MSADSRPITDGPNAPAASKVAIRVFHVDPDDIAYVGPYDLEQALSALSRQEQYGFVHYIALGFCSDQDSWHRPAVGNRPGVVLSVVYRDVRPGDPRGPGYRAYDHPPSELDAVINMTTDYYYPTKEELVQHIQTLNGLIDGESDELGQMLTPIVAMLEKMATTLLAKSPNAKPEVK